MPRRALIRFLNLQLARAGFRVSRTRPVDLRSDSSPAKTLMDRSARFERAFLLDIPIEHCRDAIGAAFDAQQPQVATLRQEAPLRYKDSPLEHFYSHCQPATAAEALGLSADEAPGLARHPPAAFVFPWRGWTPEEMLRLRDAWFREEAAVLNLSLSLRDGCNHFGPVRVEKGRLEVERLRVVAESMRRSGFLLHGNPEGWVTGDFLLQKDGSWCVQIRSGQHRTAVAAALGLASIPVCFYGVPIKREEVDYWPQVVTGRIAREGALRVFDRVMQGQPPPALHPPWVSAPGTACKLGPRPGVARGGSLTGLPQ